MSFYNEKAIKMKSLAEILARINLLIMRENDLLREHGASNYMGAMAGAAGDILQELKEWILDN